MKDFEIFDFEYPIEDEKWKEEFERLFIDHYYFYEIGAETVDRWKHGLKARLNLIMPYYNQLYISTLMEIDPLNTMNILETLEDTTKTAEQTSDTSKLTDTRATEDTGTTSSDGTVSADIDEQTKRTDYPQTGDPATDIPTEQVNQTGDNKTTSENTGQTSNSTNTDGTQNRTASREGEVDTDRNYEKVIKGFSGNQNELLKVYRENIVNINKLLIQDLKRLFILVY